MLNGESGRRKYRNSCYYFGSFSASLNFKMELKKKKVYTLSPEPFFRTKNNLEALEKWWERLHQDADAESQASL